MCWLSHAELFPRIPFSWMFLVRVGPRDILGRFWGQKGCGSHFVGLVLHHWALWSPLTLLAWISSWARHQSTFPGIAPQLHQLLGWVCVCLAPWGRAPASLGRLFHQGWWQQVWESLPIIDFLCSLKTHRLSTLAGFQPWSPPCYIGIPFWLRPCGFQTPASDTKITVLEIYRNEYRHVTM